MYSVENDTTDQGILSVQGQEGDTGSPQGWIRSYGAGLRFTAKTERNPPWRKVMLKKLISGNYENKRASIHEICR